ncbi:hypothetical protein HUN08_11885 [Gordonia sp. X0973]|uniref:hypothetical protein n=1 Tax=Gordonia sp. X0973 TaxID=2742602 RepID=UPI000F52AECF|nr:hypothetical protein [Gordonia sp. X0973]QKT07809.1 hypothetical protein HUN08_11885 [Gordonia sp. X0973]
MNRTITAAAASAALLTVLTASPAQARFAGSLGDLGSSAPPPGKLYNRNGVTKIAAGVTNVGRGAFAPAVSWSARAKSGAPVTGRRCGIEITFPGKRWPMYLSKDCQGSASFPRRTYRSPGKYTITVQDRVSGQLAITSFVVQEAPVPVG